MQRFVFYGGDNRARTGHLLNAIQALFQMSYAPRRPPIFYIIEGHNIKYNLAIKINCCKEQP